MNISKTMFKYYARCNRIFALDEVYKKKLGIKDSLFGSKDDEKIRVILSEMFDEESGDDLIFNDRENELIYYYNKTEEEAIKNAEKHFGFNIIHNIDTKKQKFFSFKYANHEIYSYLDGFFEDDDNVYVFEVKATTSKKFLELGVKIDRKFYPLFKKDGYILKINSEEKDLKVVSKLQEVYKTLFNKFTQTGKYIYDISLERFIVDNSTKNDGKKGKNKKYYLVVLNSEYVFDGKYENGSPVYDDINGESLFTFIDLSDVTMQYSMVIQNELDEMVENFDRKIEKEFFSSKCMFKSKDRCPFAKICFKKLFEKGNILEYLNSSSFSMKDEKGKVIEKKDVKDYINSEKFSLLDVEEKYLNRNKLIQRKCFENNNEYIDIQKIKKGIKEIKYPLYHLDFESFPSPLPRFIGEKPYTQSVFQFSLHKEMSEYACDKDNNHFSFLASSFEDERENLIKALIKEIDLSKGGSVLVYNDSFEKSRINELSEIFKEYKDDLLNINNHIFDLLDIVKTNKKFYQKLGFNEDDSKTINYYNNHLHGSYSIKKVLPIFSTLTYDELAVKNGSEAINVYSKYPFMEKDELEEKRMELEEYCKQDTYSMVLILWALKKLAL